MTEIHTPKKSLFPQNKHSKFILFFRKNLTKQNFSYSCSHISNSQSKLINWAGQHGKFNYGCTIRLHHPLGTQKNQFVQFVQNTESPFGKITLQLNQQSEHLSAVNITHSTQQQQHPQQAQQLHGSATGTEPWTWWGNLPDPYAY